jgi:O-antigen/teichoic acid export membrane protein
MAGRETALLKTSVQAAAANIALNLILIPAFGMVGAAAATGMSLALAKILQLRDARRHLGIAGGAWEILRR